ncbi:hypothetical protein MKZ38_001238 [Zalerion maritima]|uniref:Uncharacterized protein n=1 Tax=Zalerion maritima TaxID=339359 RepID=A0AAD5RRP1_9PEZI|nr:hypothetical protein MKZ38_001238 [Zalerion maritima]
MFTFHLTLPAPPTIRNRSSDQMPPQSLPTRLFCSLYSRMPEHAMHLWALGLLLLLSAPFLRTNSASLSSGLDSFYDLSCTSKYDAPNPIANEYPNSATGVLNGTLAIIPVDMERVKMALPAGVNILEDLLRADMPNFPEGMFPVLLQAAHDHDVQFAAYNIGIPDFSRIGLEFPYLDARGDGTPFKWAPRQLISGHNEMAVKGSRDYGTIVFESLFEPRFEAYSQDRSGAITMSAVSNDNGTRHLMETVFRRQPEVEIGAEGNDGGMPFGLDAIKSITSQITFASLDGACDRFTRLWNTSIDSTPVAIRGKVVIEGGVSPLDDSAGRMSFSNIWGVQVATAFTEDNYLDCATV